MTPYETQLRDEFAKIALTAFLNNGAYQPNSQSGHGYVNCLPSDLIEEAYYVADLAMEARNATQEDSQ